MAGHESASAGGPGEVAGQAPLPVPLDQQEFMDRLRMVDSRVVRPLTDMASMAEGTGIVADAHGLANQLNVNLAPGVLEPFTEAGERPGIFTFVPRPMARFGKENSFRRAFFGVLTVGAEGGHREEIPVVVKQYPMGGQHDATHNAVQELTLLERARELGMPAIEVVGAVMHRYTASPTIYVITRQKQGLESLDELSWKGITVADMPERLHPVVDTLSTMHGNLMFSGDPKFNNIGLGEDGRPIMFDLEHATSVHKLVATMTEENEEAVTARMADRMSNDFAHVRVSLQDIVYVHLSGEERPRSPMEQFEFEHAHVLEPYHLKLMEGNSAHKALLNKVYNRVLAQCREQAQRAQAKYDASHRGRG